MNFFKYINVPESLFRKAYIDTGLVNEATHPSFPLVIYSYSRKTVHDNLWDGVTSKTRGIIVNKETGEIVSRTFEKFHNFGSEQANDGTFEFLTSRNVQPVIWEKLDGFMVTMYEWEGKYYAASKGSFTSPHAKWATAEIQRKMAGKTGIAGATFVFEGLHPDLRIVVDYGKRKSLVLLAVIYNETGEEAAPEAVEFTAGFYGFESPKKFDISLAEARTETMRTSSDIVEGYVLTWYRTGGTPYRLKMKYVDYLRLHRMVTGVSPKRIWELLATKQSSQIEDYLNSTPWFNEFVTKWMKALKSAYAEREHSVNMSFKVIQGVLQKQYEQTRVLPLRKDWAALVMRPEFVNHKNELFAMLDGKDPDVLIWKQLKQMTKGVQPMVDAHA